MKRAVVICVNRRTAAQTYNEVLRCLSDQRLIPAGSPFTADPNMLSFRMNGWSVRFLFCRKKETLSHLRADYTVPYHPEAEKGDAFKGAPHTIEDLMTRILGRRYE